MIDFLKKHTDTRAFLLYILLISILYAPVVFDRKTLQPPLYQPHGIVDGWTYGYNGRRPVNVFNVDLATPIFYEWPINKLVGDLYRNGEIPLWNPYQAGGTPLAANYSTRVFFPYQILENMSPVWMWDIFILGRLLIAGFFSYLFLSRVGLSFRSAFLGGVLYMFSGTMVWFINLEQMANVAMLVPLVMYSMESIINGGVRHITLGGIVFALVLTGGQPEIALYVIFLALCYFVFRTVSLNLGRGIVLMWIRFVCALGLGLLLSAPLILPFLEFVSLAHHIHPPGSDMGLDSNKELWRRVFIILTPTLTELPVSPSILKGILAALPDPSGKPFYFRIFATNGIWDYLGGYIGFLCVFLAFTGMLMVLAGRVSTVRGHVLFFTSFGSAVLLKNFGVIPFVWLGYLPLFDQVWSLRWAGPVWVFAFSMAGACGLEIISRYAGRERGDRFRAYYIIPSLVFLLLLLVYTFLPLSDALALTIKRHVLYDSMTQPYLIPSLLTGCIVSIILLSAVFLMTLYCIRKGSGFYGIVGLTVLELWWAIPRGYDYNWLYLKLIPFGIGFICIFVLMKERWRTAIALVFAFFGSFLLLDRLSPYGFPERYDPFTEPPYVKFLRERIGYQRVMGGYGVLFPNFASAVGIQDLRYVSALAIFHFKDYRINHLQVTLEKEETDSFAMWFTGRPERNVDYRIVYRKIEDDIKERLPYYSMLGVRYFLFPAYMPSELDLPLIYDREIRIYENPQALPRVFVSYAFETVSSTEEAQKNHRADYVLIEGPVDMENEPQKPAGFDTARIVEYSTRKVVIDAEARKKGILVLTDVFYPGWTAYVDGKPARIYRVNGIVRGVLLEKGTHRVTFHYSPLSFKIGLVLSGIGLLTITVLMVWRRGGP